MMGDLFSTKEKVYRKDIYLSGEYIRYFNPDDRRNPFSKIYSRKKQDTLDIIKKFGSSKSILDVGGGMGRLSIALARMSRYNVVLTDISMDVLKQAIGNTDKLVKIDVVASDAHDLPFRDDSFDCVVGLDLLCHLEKPERALSEFHRVLSDQGMLILDSTNSNPFWTLFYPRYLGKNPLTWFRIVKYRGVYPGWQVIVKHYSKREFFTLLKKMGFNIVKSLNYGPLICPKWHLAVSKKNIE